MKSPKKDWVLLPEETFLGSPRKMKERASEKIWIAPDFFLTHMREFFLARGKSF